MLCYHCHIRFESVRLSLFCNNHRHYTLQEYTDNNNKARYWHPQAGFQNRSDA